MWELLGESDKPFRMVSAVTNPRSTGLEVFGLAEDGSVWQNVATADDWTGWSLFGRRPDPGRLFASRSNPGLVSLGVNLSHDIRLRVIGAASDGSAWMNEQTWGYGEGWGGWLRFGAIANWRRRLSVVPDGWTRLGVVSGALREVVVPSCLSALAPLVLGLGVDDTAWINTLAPAPVRPEQYLGWQEFGDTGLHLSSLVMGRPDDLTIEAIGIRSDDNTVWRNSAVYPWRLAQWTGWQPFGAAGDQFRAVTSLRTGVWDGSESDVFALALDDTIWRRAPGANAWVPFGDPADRLRTITPIWGTNGIALGLAGTAPDHSTWHAALLPSGQWGPLEPFGSPPSEGLRELTFTQTHDFRVHAFGIAPDGTVWTKYQMPPGTWPPP